MHGLSHGSIFNILGRCKMNIRLKQLFIYFLVSFILAVVPETYIWAEERCEIVKVDKLNPLYTARLKPYHIKNKIEDLKTKNGLTESKAKGVVGELVARNIIERRFIWPDRLRRVSITTMFENFGCSVTEYLRDKADRGLDDVFVVLNKEGWINKNYNPVFHEAKYDGRCKLVLRDTNTLCEQLSVNWLNGNVKKAAERTKASICFDDHNEFIFQTCQYCKVEFQQNIEWLRDKLQHGSFYRTASILCADGSFNLYRVNN